MRRLRYALLAVALATALAGALGTLASHAWWLELFCHFQPQYAALLAACAGGLLYAGPRLIGLLCLGLACLNALPLAHYFVPVARVEIGGTPFKAVFANIYFGNRDFARVTDFVRAERPDVVVFSEVTGPWQRQLRSLADVLPYQAMSGELLVASRQPLGQLRSVALSNAGAGALLWRQGELALVGAHANWPLGEHIAALRDAELVRLAGLAASQEGPVLLLADLNVTAFSPSFARLLMGSGLADCAAGRGWHPTWPVLFPPAGIQIDHCLHSAGVAIDVVRTGPWVGSDHYPLIVEGRLLPPRRRDLSAGLARSTARR
jgi:endonuclease/exonuclease/phosphatase (EEP) superfamily protein YafD